MVKRLASLFSTARLDDPVFGELRFQRVGFWEGKCFFPPIAREVETTVDVDERGPSPLHHQFFAELSERWTKLLALAVPLVLKRSIEWVEVSSTRLWERFRLEGVGIPDPSISPLR